MHNMTYGTMYEPIPHEQVYLVGIGLCSQTQTVFAETISIFQNITSFERPAQKNSSPHQPLQ
jgi:hypothetical protein